MVLWRQWFKIDRAWVERREAILRAQEDAAIRAARDEATGRERMYLEALLAERPKTAQGAPPAPPSK